MSEALRRRERPSALLFAALPVAILAALILVASVEVLSRVTP